MANKINDNGIIRDMTEKEIKEHERLNALFPQVTKDAIEDRLEKLEKLLSRLASMLGVRE